MQQPEATLLAATIAACAAIVGALIGVGLAFFQSVKTRSLQLELRKIEQSIKETERNEGRRYTLKLQYVTPFLNELFHCVEQAQALKSNVDRLQAVCPLSADFKATLLQHTELLSPWGDSAIELVRHRANVVLALDEPAINDFLEKTNELVILQIGLVNQFIDKSFRFGSDEQRELDAKFAKYRKLIASLFILTRTSIHADAKAQEIQLRWDEGGTADAMFTSLPSRGRLGGSNRFSWCVWWTLSQEYADPSDALGTFLADLRRLVDAARTLEGVIDVSEESATAPDDGTRHFGLTIVFVSEPYLRTYLEALASIKNQSRPLWLPSTSPVEFSS